MPIDMTLAASAPPRQAGSRRQSQTAPRKTQTDSRAEAVNGLFQLGSFGSVMVGHYADAAALSEHGPNISKELAVLGQKNEKIGQWIDYLTEAGPYAGLLTAVLPLALQMLANHGRIDYSKVPGVSDPKVLETRIQAEMMRAAAAEKQRYQQEIASMEAVLAMDSQNGQPQQ